MEPADGGQAFVVVGVLLLAGVAAEALSRRIGLPRVTLLVLLGVVVGPGVLDVLPPAREQWFPIVSTIALVMVGFLVGGEFTRDRLRDEGREVAGIAVVQALLTATVVAAGLLALGFQPAVALTLAGIAAATDPASTYAVAQDYGRQGWLSRTMIGVVALDDVLTIVLFSVLLAVATVLEGSGAVLDLLGTASWEIGGALVLALLLGPVVAYLTGRLRPGEPTREEAIGVVLLLAGIAVWLDVSFVLAAVALGAIVANLATHHERPFHEIENIEWPFIVVFFVLAGAQLRFTELATAGLLGGAFVALRILGKVAGGAAGAKVAGGSDARPRWLGPALLPQAGLALGLALLAGERFPELSGRLIAVVVATTVLFELVGPALARVALSRAES